MGFLFCPPDCPDRKPACHSKCERYKARKKEYDRLKKKEDKEKEARLYVATMNRIRRDRIAKRRHLRPGRDK